MCIAPAPGQKLRRPGRPTHMGNLYNFKSHPLLELAGRRYCFVLFETHKVAVFRPKFFLISGLTHSGTKQGDKSI